MSHIERNSRQVDPEEPCLIVYQILKAVSYLHRSGITHRDLKPENILMSNAAAGARVVVTDLGGVIKTTANRRGISNRMQTVLVRRSMSHRMYFSPLQFSAAQICDSEIRGKNSLVRKPGYTNAVDMWSIGCVTAALLIGGPAFAMSQASTSRQDSAAVVIAAAAKCDLSVLDDPEVWGDIDVRAKDLIRRLLVLDDRARLTADQALRHDWFTYERNGDSIATRYDQGIAGWKPSCPGWDLKEHLDCFIEGRIPKSDASSLYHIEYIGRRAPQSQDTASISRAAILRSEATIGVQCARIDCAPKESAAYSKMARHPSRQLSLGCSRWYQVARAHCILHARVSTPISFATLDPRKPNCQNLTLGWKGYVFTSLLTITTTVIELLHTLEFDT